jgi:hypothetical protein
VKQTFTEAVGAISPLNGVIDGSVKPKPKRAKAQRRERMDASRTFFCRNKNCGHKTWSPLDQARHMHAEFVWAMEALVMRAPESPEALLLTGGTILAKLTDDECRAAQAEASRLRKAGASPLEIPPETRLRFGEYQRRWRTGILVPAEARVRVRRDPRSETCGKGHALDDRWRCRVCEREGKRERMRDPELRERHREQRRVADRKRRARKKAGREANDPDEPPVRTA